MLYFWLALILFVSSELVAVLGFFFFNLAFTIAPAVVSGAMLAVWEVTTTLVLLHHSLKGYP